MLAIPGLHLEISEGGQDDDLWGAKLSLIPSHFVCREACGTLHAMISTVCAYAGFHETKDIPGYLISGTNFELSHQYLVGLVSFPV